MKLPVKFSSTDEAIRRLVLAINVNADGKYGTVTLAAGATSTTLTDVNLTAASVISLTPTTANAAAAIATTFIGAVVIGGATITHANNATVDRIFKYAVTG